MRPSNKAPKTVRKHVTTACTPCREGKVKCDGATPECKNCRTKGKTCSYNQNNDRRKIPVRISVTILAQRINQLSKYIREKGLEVPQMEKCDIITLKGVFDSLGLQCNDFINLEPAPATTLDTRDHNDDQELGGSLSSHLNDRGGESNVITALSPPLTGPDAQDGRPAFFTLNPAPPPAVTAVECSPTRPSCYGAAADSPSPMAAVASIEPPQQAVSALLELADASKYHSTLNEPASNQTIPPATQHRNGQEQDREQAQEQEEEEEQAEEDEVTRLLSCRLGRLQATHGGQLRYYGSTSNLTLLDALVGVAPSSSSSILQGAQEVLERAELDLAVDEFFEEHLIKLYFAWQDPCLHGVNEEIFWKSRAQYSHNDSGSGTPYYSLALSNAMCAIGAVYEPRYHPNLVTFPRSLSEFFSDRTKALLELELENPSLATIQTLVILSGYEASCTRDTRGWLYSGMAMRLALDLGLHLRTGPYVEKGIIPAENAEIRRITFWGVYMNERFWGYYLGRFIQTPTESITVLNPGHDNPLPTTKWKAYGSACSSMNTSTTLPNPLDLVCCQWASLYGLMEPLTDVLYGCSEVSKHRLQELTANTVDKLNVWKRDLPQELNIYEITAGCLQQQPLPHILALHMQFYQLMIHCHRPYISRSIQPQPPQGPGTLHARMTCIESAIAIVNILNLYERFYTFRRANFQIVSYIFSAALILIFTTCEQDRDRELVEHLSTCFRALDEMGAQIDSAKRASTFLSSLQREWQIQRRSKMRAARGAKRKFQTFVRESTPNWQQQQNPAASDPLFPFRVAGGGGNSRSSANGINAVVAGSTTTTTTNGAAGAAIDYDLASCYPSLEDYSVDFMEPDLCNILLSEGIPRTFA